MKPRLIALQLFLDQLGVSSEINSLEDRVRVQKAVYLGQLSGIDFGYRFSWYLKGPYCSKLTKDYYELEEAINLGEDDFEKMKLKTSIREKLDNIYPLLEKPEASSLADEEWLELVASYHYLIGVRGCNKNEAQDTLKEEKPHLIDSLELADTRLSEAGLLN